MLTAAAGRWVCPGIVAALAAAVAFACRRFVDAGRFANEQRIDEERRKLEALSRESERLAVDEAAVKERELALVTVYEITKRMSGSLTFDDIFSVFSSFLNENLTFGTCDLLTLNYDDPEPRLDRRYRVLKEASPKASADRAADYTRLIRLFLHDPKDIYIARDENPKAFADLGICDDAVTTFVGIPLQSERRVVAILMFENLPKADFEMAAILSMQFALEIKKVLLYETVERLSVTDSLTGLYVRRYFFERFAEEVERSKSYGFAFAFLMIDIDDFKKCNDTYGHLVGDVVLKDVARLMKENVREIDLVSRYGGEEFAVVLPETGPEGARHAAERIRKRIEEHVFKAYDEKVRVTISGGVAFYPDAGGSVAELVEKADQALYKAKRSGKNVVCVYKK